MKTSNAGIIELIGHEGVCLSSYYDSAGVKTIGIGMTASEIPDLASWPMSKTLTMQQVFDMFKQGLVKYEDAVNSDLHKPVTQTQFDALVSVCYNIGVGGEARSSFIREINEGASVQDIYNAILLWDKPPEIKGRRLKEALLFKDGVYSEGGYAEVFPVSGNGNPLYGRGYRIQVSKYIQIAPQTPSTSSIWSELLNYIFGKLFNGGKKE